MLFPCIRFTFILPQAVVSLVNRCQSSIATYVARNPILYANTPNEEPIKTEAFIADVVTFFLIEPHYGNGMLMG